MNSQPLRTASLILPGVAALVMLALFVYTTEFALDDAIYIGISAIWVLSPYLALFVFARRTSHRPSGVLTSLGVFVVSAIAPAAIADSFFWHVDAQGGLVLLFVPVLQWAGIAVLFLTNKILAGRRVT